MSEIPNVFHIPIKVGSEVIVQRLNLKEQKATILVQVFPSLERANEFIDKTEGRGEEKKVA